MTTSERIPPLLSPYIRVPPPDSLALVTSTVNTTTNWVLLRYLYAALGGNEPKPFRGSDVIANGTEDVGVVFVSWMRDLAFWKTEARKAVGLDLGRLQQQGRFAFVDGLTSLFAPPIAEPAPKAVPTAPLPSRTPTSTRSPLPTRGPGPVPPRQPSVNTPSTPSGTVPSAIPPSRTQTQTNSPFTLTSPTLTSILSTITTALTSLTTPRTLLILDTPSLLLHITTPPLTSADLTSFLLSLRSHPTITSTILALPADPPFLAPAQSAALAYLHNHRLHPGESSKFEPMAAENANFIVSAVQMASWVVSCRMLGTGWAEDVSGVVRVTRGGYAEEDEDEGPGEGVKEGEWLYSVAGDGGVRVWGRGESGR